MARLVKGIAGVVLGLACSVATAQNDDQKSGSKDAHHEGQKSAQQQDQGQRQTIRGTIAGVTAVGEAVIDPETNTAIVAEVDYLTILGSPARGDAHGDHGGTAQQNKNQADATKDQADHAQQAGLKDKVSQRQNVYLVAITPETKVRLANSASSSDASSRSSDKGQKDSQDKNKSAGDQSNASDADSQQAFDKLEIGDKVRVEFVSTGRMRGKMDKNLHASNSAGSDQGTEHAAGFRGTGKQRQHGRHRIMIGQAKSIAITSLPSSKDQGSTPSDEDGDHNGQGKDQNQDQNQK